MMTPKYINEEKKLPLSNLNMFAAEPSKKEQKLQHRGSMNSERKQNQAPSGFI